jgi:hypothetical membrane protein
MSDDRLQKLMLGIGIAVPFLYFGAQLVALPFYPGYDMVSQVASELGSPQSTQPWVLNSLIILTGLAQLIAAIAIPRALARLEAWPWIAWAIGIILAMAAVGTIKAGIFAMPDPRHGSMGYLAVSLMVFSPLLLAALWPREDTLKLKIYLAISILATLALLPILSGATGIDIPPIKGLLQRIFALATFPPIAVASAYLLRHPDP